MGIKDRLRQLYTPSYDLIPNNPSKKTQKNPILVFIQTRFIILMILYYRPSLLEKVKTGF